MSRHSAVTSHWRTLCRPDRISVTVLTLRRSLPSGPFGAPHARIVNDNLPLERLDVFRVALLAGSDKNIMTPDTATLSPLCDSDSVLGVPRNTNYQPLRNLIEGRVK